MHKDARRVPVTISLEQKHLELLAKHGHNRSELVRQAIEEVYGDA